MSYGHGEMPADWGITSRLSAIRYLVLAIGHYLGLGASPVLAVFGQGIAAIWCAGVGAFCGALLHILAQNAAHLRHPMMHPGIDAENMLSFLYSPEPGRVASLKLNLNPRAWTWLRRGLVVGVATICVGRLVLALWL